MLTIIKKLIERQNISVGQFLQLALYHPQCGYYTNKNPLGKQGDYITSPEISDAFGIIIGLFAKSCWQNVDKIEPINLLELGPGTGKLTQDICRVFPVVNIHFLEKSPILRKLQQENLHKKIFFYDDIADLPELEGFTFIIANEFFDALPIEQWRMHQTHSELLEVCLKDDQLYIDHSGTIKESCPLAHSILQTLQSKLQTALLMIIDYGYNDGFGNTLQGLLEHKPVDILQDPGNIDISHHVDFSALKKSLSGYYVKGPFYQGEFLKHLGIEQLPVKNPMALYRLLSMGQMGGLFRILIASNKQEILRDINI